MMTAPELSTDAQRTAEIARLNDETRARRLKSSRVVFTRSLVDLLREGATTDGQALGQQILGQGAIMKLIANTTFTEGNDPYGERDMAFVEYNGHKIYGKIDYYSDDTCTWGAEEPWDASKSFRVLTVMLASDY